MSDKKPGFFKRIFSFGRSAPREEEAPETLPAPEAIEPQVAETLAVEAPVEEVAKTPQPPAAPEKVPAKHGKPSKPVSSTETAKPAKPGKAEKPDKQDKRDRAARPAKSPSTVEPSAPPAPVTSADMPTRPRKGKVALDGKSAGDEGDTKSIPDGDEAKPGREKTGWFARLRKGLSRSSQALGENIAAVFTKRKLDEDTLQELEDILVQADLGIETAMRVTDALSDQRYGKDVTDAEVRAIMAGEIESVLSPVARSLELDLDHQPHVILVVGVNGSGKTTTIGKLSAKLKAGGFSTLLVAGDTFRAAAIEQLKIWGERTGSPVIAREIGADAAGLAFDAWTRARDEGHDVMLMDTAGRLQNKTELMAELEKIIRVLRKQDPTAPHTVLLTLDATTGQNALNQVDIFGKVAGVNGLVMTKLDGTARGGILVAIAAKYKMPVYFLGVGEGIDDLEPFEARDFARSIAGLSGSDQTATGGRA